MFRGKKVDDEKECIAESCMDVSHFRSERGGALHCPRITSYNVCYTKLLRAAEQVVLEVLENISSESYTHFRQQIMQLKKRGFQIAIDDFGSESSNFSRLMEIQADFIKIDGSFIKNLDHVV